MPAFTYLVAEAWGASLRQSCSILTYQCSCFCCCLLCSALSRLLSTAQLSFTSTAQNSCFDIMAFRATAVACSKASRLPLTSKQANKDFYKGATPSLPAFIYRFRRFSRLITYFLVRNSTGPGALPGFGQRAQGRVPIRSKAPYKKDIKKMRYFVAPEGWLDESGQMKAVFTTAVSLQLPQGSARVNGGRLS